jgi:nucleoside-triphosphatase THEP1
MRRWALIVGPKGSAKSLLARRAAEALSARGVAVDGVVQEAQREGGETVAFRARRIAESGDAILLAGHGAAPQGTRAESAFPFCGYVFDVDAFARAGEWVREAARNSRVVLVDEVSKLEVARGGHHDAIRDAFTAGALVILVVRADQLFAVVERFELDDAVATLDIADADDLEGFVDAVAASASA